MRKVFSLILLLLPLYAFTQIVSLGVSKDLGWAEWFYETLEFRDDCTILKGYFVPSKNGCWVISKMNETLKTDGKEYRIIYTTLPINRHPRTTYPGGIKVYFEEHFEPIFSTGGIVQLTNHNILFPIPFDNRKRTKPLEDLLSAYEEHIDTLISQGKYDIAAFLLNQYAKDAWLLCSYNAKKKLSREFFSKYRLQDFFLNASSDYESIWAKFEHAYRLLDYKGDDKILKQFHDICTLQCNIVLNINGENHSKVIEWCESLMSKIHKLGKYNRCYDYALSLYRKALVMDGQIQKIPELDNEIIDVCSHIYDTRDMHYLEHLMNIASDLDIRPSKTSYNTDISINIWKEVRDRAMKNFPNSWIYASALKEIADYNYNNRHFGVARMQYLSIDSLYKVRRNELITEVWYYHDYLSHEESVSYVNLMQESLSSMIGKCYYQQGDIANATKYDENNPYYNYALGNYEKLVSWCENSYIKSIKGLKDIIKKPTIWSPGAYYEEVFDIVYSPTLTIHIPYFAYKTKSSDLCEKAYNGALITKEFRLTANNRLRQYLKTTPDTISLDYNFRIDKEMSTYHSMIKAHDLGSVEKHWEVVQLQKEFMAYLDSIGALDTFFPNWTDVRDALKENEVAVEFIEFPLWNQNQSIYAALTVRKKSEYPKITTLFEEKQLKLVPDTLYYQCREMTNLVWTPLLSELQGVNNIYFSPSGTLYSIGIEYLPDMESYNIYRLSSTRELALKKQQQETSKKAVLYGGLKYYAELDTTSKAKSQAALDATFIEHANVRNMGLRGGMEDLEHTKIEVDRIREEFKKANWICLLDTASMGTEESFKSLSGKRIGCLHVATHGFYYTKEEADNARYQFMLLDNIASVEDKALTRSGLLLSGANHILEDHIIPDNVEDGILTAKEIAEVDLRGLDLVVLSACQTGLGDIAQGEGVFGLQRGFKKAGANTILMSLWKVDDEATEILMTQFYKNWLSGQSKHQSLLNAQKNLREYRNANGEQCYNSPKYWAAFILLDGIK